MAVHGGLLRLDTPGNGEIVDLTRGVASVVRHGRGRPRARVGVRHRLDGRRDHDGVRARRRARPAGLLDRLIPAQGDYEHNRLNHDTNSHAHLRAALIGPSETVPMVERTAGPGHLAADRADRLRRPAAEPDGDRPGLVVGAGCYCPRAANRLRRRSPPSPSKGHDFGAILAGPLRDPAGSGRALRRKPLLREVATVFENSTACAPPTDPSVEECVQVRRRRRRPVFGSLERRCQD